MKGSLILSGAMELIDESDKSCVVVGMSTRTLRHSEAESNELQAAFLHCQEADTKIRFQAVRLYGMGYPVAQIQDICGGSARSLSNWSRAYQDRGIPALLDHRCGGNRARLTPSQSEAVH